jgi:hypothetical protein
MPSLTIQRLSRLLLPAILVVLSACGGGDDDESIIAPAQPERGDLIDGQPVKLASYSPQDLLARLADNGLGAELLQVLLTPKCSIDVHQLKYQTVNPSGAITPASGALMIPNGTDASCQGSRPILLYAHGTSTDSSYNIADLQNADNGEGLIVAAVFAAQGYIVVAPNYLGYDTSTLDYHPYLNGDQQSKEMIDALTAARSALPTSSASNTTDNGKLLITGYSEGGYVAMATHRAMQAAGAVVTASAPMSGPYALSAFGDAIFEGQVSANAPVNLTLLLSSYQHAYGNIYTNATDAFESQYATGIDTLLPSATPVGDLESQGKLPANALFSSTPPDPAFASMTPATSPANLADVFAAGFGTDNLLTNSFRLAYLQDAEANPDGGFPTVTDGLPPTSPQNALRQALKTNDQRNWTPTSPMLLCAGNSDPTVFYLNTELMQSYWSSASTVTVLDIDSPPTSNDPYEDLKAEFTAAKNLVQLSGGDSEVLDAYHATLVPPFCLSAVKAFFDAH